MDLLTSNIKASIQRDHLITDGDKVIVTLSGGADSVALLSVLVKLDYDCIVAHCNFHLRGEESNRDCTFAQSLSQALGVECIVRHFDVTKYEQEHKVSTEMACRKLRYEWFEQLRRQYAPAVIAVAHHRDDNIETFFLNLLRGTGIAGLTGMAPRNGHVIRPMLNCTRQDIEQYLADNGLDYVTDSTNALNDYRRNRVRNIIMPMLNEQFPGASQAIASTIEMLRDNESIYRSAIDNARNRYLTGSTINLKALIANEQQATTILFELIRPMGFNYTQASDIIAAAKASGRQFFAGKNILTIHRGTLIITTLPDSQPDEYIIDLTQAITTPINLTISIVPNNGTITKPASASTIMLDASVLDGNPQFVLRHWHEGDRIAPFGMKGTKKVSDIFTDAHLSVIDKQKVWLLTRNDEILWIIGHRTSRHYPITPTSTHIITITANE